MIEKFKNDKGEIAVIVGDYFGFQWYTNDDYRSAYGEKMLFDPYIVSLLDKWKPSIHVNNPEEYNDLCSKFNEYLKETYPLIKSIGYDNLIIQWIIEGERFTIKIDGESNEILFTYDELTWLTA